LSYPSVQFSQVSRLRLWGLHVNQLAQYAEYIPLKSFIKMVWVPYHEVRGEQWSSNWRWASAVCFVVCVAKIRRLELIPVVCDGSRHSVYHIY
jgi:hypothetical protein